MAALEPAKLNQEFIEVRASVDGYVTNLNLRVAFGQRVPVRVHLELVPEEVELPVGTTASALVVTGGGREQTEVPPKPRALR